MQWRLSGFREIKELGRGAQGRVVLAERPGMAEPVAIKYLLESRSGDRARFRREAGLLQGLDHPNVVRFYDLIESDDGAALIMEAVPGVPLKTVLASRRRIVPQAAATLLWGSLRGLAAAHRLGVVHRDYKPANVIVRGDGVTKIIDFGVAAWSGGDAREATPAYMAPEQWRGEPAGPAADVYAATCVLFECVTGRLPFGAADLSALASGGRPGTISLQDVPEELRPVVQAGLAQTVAERPPNAAEFSEELRRIAEAVYGPSWQEDGAGAMAGAAAAFATLFPTAATTGATAPAAAVSTKVAAGAAASKFGTVAAAVGGSAAVLAITGVVAVVQEPAPRPTPPPVAATASAPSMEFRGLRLPLNATWKPQPRDKTDGSIHVRNGQRCLKLFDRTDCPGFLVFGPANIARAAESADDPYESPDPDSHYGRAHHYHPGTGVDICYHPKAYNGRYLSGEWQQTADTLVAVGTKNAEYRERKITCMTNESATSPYSFRQREWYLPEPGILIVDRWSTQGLTEALAAATWT